MTDDRSKDRTVVLYRSSDLFEIEGIAQCIREAGIQCHVDGINTAGAFAGFTALDGVSMMSILVLESDAAAAERTVERYLRDTKPGDDPV